MANLLSLLELKRLNKTEKFKFQKPLMMEKIPKPSVTILIPSPTNSKKCYILTQSQQQNQTIQQKSWMLNFTHKLRMLRKSEIFKKSKLRKNTTKMESSFTSQEYKRPMKMDKLKYLRHLMMAHKWKSSITNDRTFTNDSIILIFILFYLIYKITN